MPTGRPPRALLPVVLGFLLLGVTGASAIVLSLLQSDAVYSVRHSLEVENQISLAGQLLVQAEASQRGYMLTGNPVFEQRYRRAAGEVAPAMRRLAERLRDNPDQRRNLLALQPVVAAKMAELDGRTALVHAGRVQSAVAILDRPDRGGTLHRVTQGFDAMLGGERALLQGRITRAERLTTATRVALATSLALVALFALWSLAEARRRVARLVAAYRRLGEEIVERDAAQEQVRQLQKMEALGQLTGGIAHDFNNMLAVVIGSLEIAGRRLTGDEHPSLSGSLGNATAAARRAAELTARLLAFSRRQPLEPHVLDPNRLVRDMSELLSRTLGETVAVETVLAGGLRPVCADTAQLENAILNLAVNARDAMPGGGTLTIQTANVRLDEADRRIGPEVIAGRYVMIALTDTGVGMTREVTERAFDPFYTTKEVGRGTGLGLSQVHGFVKQSAGHVAIESEPGAGTTVAIYLPQHEGPGGPARRERVETGEPAAGAPDTVILVAEDEARVRHMTVDALRELGYTVVAAGDGTEALEQLALQPRVDLLFTDIVMPGMNGQELAERATGLKPGLRVLYTTGYARNAIPDARVAGTVALITKPFSLDTLARRIRETLDS